MVEKSQALEMESWGPILIPSLTQSCGALGKSFHLSEPFSSSVK